MLKDNYWRAKESKYKKKWHKVQEKKRNPRAKWTKVLLHVTVPFSFRKKKNVFPIGLQVSSFPSLLSIVSFLYISTFHFDMYFSLSVHFISWFMFDSFFFISLDIIIYLVLVTVLLLRVPRFIDFMWKKIFVSNSFRLWPLQPFTVHTSCSFFYSFTTYIYIYICSLSDGQAICSIWRGWAMQFLIDFCVLKIFSRFRANVWFWEIENWISLRLLRNRYVFSVYPGF